MNEIEPFSGEAATGGPFDNVAVRTRGERCVAASVAPPFQAVYWPEVGEAASRLGLEGLTAASLAAPEARARFLGRLAGEMGGAFRPARIGFGSPPWQVRGREAFRQDRLSVIFIGAVRRAAALASLEAACGRARRGGAVDVQFKGWDALADWAAGREAICDVCGYLYETRGRGSNVLVWSELRQIPDGLWQFVYERPRVRVAWRAEELAPCRDGAGFEAIRRGSAALENLEQLGSAGLWPHVVLPVTRRNVKGLPELVQRLLEATRGGSIELAPAGLGPAQEPVGGGETGPSVEEYVEAVGALYRKPEVPLKLVSPLSWVLPRVNSQGAMIGSAASAGAEMAALPEGELYAGEFGVGAERWRLGNVLKEPGGIRWERLDAMAEASSNAMQPEECQRCDWRYRCGGPGASLPLSGGRRGPANGQTSRFELYCAPRKRLFDEMVWDWAERAALGHDPGPRERIELREDGINFAPVNPE